MNGEIWEIVLSECLLYSSKEKNARGLNSYDSY